MDLEQRLDQRLAAIAARAEASLADCLAGRGNSLALAPERLSAAMAHGTLAGGKRFRPFLLVECARLFGHEEEAALPAAAAIEVLHCYSLIHDDLPAMDDDDLRRGRPTVHRAYDEATAILAGDALLTLAFEILADPATDPDPAVRIALSLRLARAAGAGGMVGGQMLDLAAEGRSLSEAEIRRLQAMKTGALITAACAMGAELGRAPAEDVARIVRYGDLIGLAFQLADDLLDVEATAETAGKRTGKDAERGKATLVSIHGAAWARGELDRLVAEAQSLLAPYGAAADTLAAAARFVADRRS
ncbi:polyprenyl synthetase family protein [Segnochrobactrum spirostomi]|uniref:Probable farnesyl diphosphate synthase n=1 Tax=Segnochrobactrum spirostomi TaxID=2608987 RepID=A0A6A7Y626_9HYPH|nr:farnesyl diphosphate synthase [Segnochrobactrum spirostomi]MQT13548.1 polyprenyl synthetase family protein [Segnochrobactrum spirostomi]